MMEEGLRLYPDGLEWENNDLYLRQPGPPADDDGGWLGHYDGNVVHPTMRATTLPQNPSPVEVKR